MLFSRAEVASYINRNFEPVWESVRPVPIVRIDFGNGNVVTRTLHGNIVTYACTRDGAVLDALPGIYAPAVYLDGLKQLRLLANYVDQGGKVKLPGRLREYHQAQAAALKKNDPPPRLVNMADMAKRTIEGGIKAVLVPGQPARAVPAPAESKDGFGLETAEDVANWKALAEDTRQNESIRRRQVHEMLATDKPHRPEQVTKRLYKEVLHADIDDPYLGLGETLFANYPFKGEKTR